MAKGKPHFLQVLLNKTDSRCHLCRGALQLHHYGYLGPLGWEIDHSVPRAKGGTDHVNNLLPAHGSCNREKGTLANSTIRKRNGFTRRPLSRRAQEAERIRNAFHGGGLGALVGLLFPGGWLIGALAGALIGHSADPE